MESIICIELMGGLGNQLFQYSAGIAISKKYNIPLLLIRERDNAHNIYKYDYRTIMMEGYHIDNDIDPNNFMGGMIVYNQSSGFEQWSVDMFKSIIGKPILLRGYFQYLPAINEVLEEIIKDINNKLREYKEKMKIKYEVEEKSIFLHVRRGDYVGKPDYHYLQTEEYYMKAYDIIKPEGKVYIVSDDIEWCKKQEWLDRLDKRIYVDEDELNTISLMSECNAGGIIANSTFSWWGAQLSEGKRIIYPSRWINEKIYNLFPPHWISI